MLLDLVFDKKAHEEIRQILRHLKNKHISEAFYFYFIYQESKKLLNQHQPSKAVEYKGTSLLNTVAVMEFDDLKIGYLYYNLKDK
jgi:hypothetical protein